MFICTGNTCRSAMAHHLAEKIAKEKKKDIQIYSCGIYAITGDEATNEAKEVMKEYEVDLRGHKATNIKEAPINEMDLLLCATEEHKQIVIHMYPELKEKTYTIKEYAEKGSRVENKDIKDPWGYTLATYRKCASEIETCLEKIIQ